MSRIKLFTSDNINLIELQSNNEFQKKYIIPLIKEGTKSFISNVESTVVLLQVGEQLFPVTINEKEYENSYVSSMYSSYISYPKEELEKINNGLLRFFLKIIISIFGLFFKVSKINKVVVFNNWFLSTNLYPQWDGNDIQEITDFLVKNFPDHVIVSRSLNAYSNKNLLQRYVKNGYQLIPSRQVYLFDKEKVDYFKKSNIKYDSSLLKKTHYKVVSHDEITTKDYARILELYNKLYIDKYSSYNPKFSEKMIANWHENKIFTMQGLRNELGDLDGIIGNIDMNGISTTPLVGYDTRLPVDSGLYRMLMFLALQHTDRKNMLWNASSGASKFKYLRGAKNEIEYSAIYNKHISLHRRIIWKILGLLLKYIATPILKKYKL